MVIDLLIYAAVTLVTLRYAAPWLTSGKVAFTAREGNVLMPRLAAVVIITVLYAVLSIALNMVAPFMGQLLVGIMGKGLATGCAYALLFSSLDVLIMALSIKGVSAVMKKSITAETFVQAVYASLIVTVLATIAQTAFAVAVLNIAQ